MTRAALLPTPGDPFLLSYWLTNYERVWADEVDRLLVLVNGQQDPAILAHFAERIAAVPHATLLTLPNRMDHGRALNVLYDATDADEVLFCEDDALVRSPGAIAAAFDRLASHDVVGSPRGGYSAEIESACGAKWGERFGAPDTGEVGFGIWPAFFFARRSSLDRTDRHFGARNWSPGETVAGLGLRVNVPVSADTMAAIAFQLWDDFDVGTHAQYRLSDSVQAGSWFHIGSLSAGYGNAFRDDAGFAAPFSPGNSGWEWERRVAWWERFWRTGTFLPEHRARYRAALDDFKAANGISPDGVEINESLTSSLITWDETQGV